MATKGKRSVEIYYYRLLIDVINITGKTNMKPNKYIKPDLVSNNRNNHGHVVEIHK
jgi:hypothetical protein